ncbi:phenylacetate--CoA ligase family protein [Rhizobium ruizarguesonis]|uniref:hypothetical protein n=1 Tax=Rhizobium ruizarguesonis TaxID=2081791 RepID=UPI0010316357|nr:hypothetical protein [Rhizobium ruizarguesonis]TAT70035.1 hypothetical protein ELI52_38420 [Rhizobium ruizarguesonis]
MTFVDSDTGFAAELSSSALADFGIDSAAVRQHLAQFGLTNDTMDLTEVRRKQRKVLSGNRSLHQRLQDRLEVLCRSVPYFTQRRSQYDPALIDGLESFATLPLMRRRDIRQSFPHDLLPNNLDLHDGVSSGRMSFVATSGSTGDRIQVLSSSMIERLPFGSDDLFGVPIGGSQPRTAFFTTPVCSSSVCFRQATSYEDRISTSSPDLLLQPTADPFSINAGLVKAFFAEITDFRPIILAADPIYLQCLVRAARKYELPLPSVPLIQTGFEFRTELSLRDLKQAFQCPVLDDYGASEENRLAVECHRGCLHVREDAIYLEIINGDGACAPGTVGNVVITTFDTVTPLVRYLIGDLASWTTKRCDCEFSSWPTIELHGRSKDLLRSKGEWISSLQIDRAIQAPEWLDFYRVTQTDKEIFEAELITAPGGKPQMEEFAQLVSPYLDPGALRIRIVQGFELLPSLKVGTTLTMLSTPEIIP